MVNMVNGTFMVMDLEKGRKIVLSSNSELRSMFYVERQNI